MAKSLLTLKDITREDLFAILKLAGEDKRRIKGGKFLDRLKGKVVGLLFEKPSTRTRNAFECAILRLGGQAVYMASSELQLKRGEPIKDVARILGGYFDALVGRVYEHSTVEALAEFSGVPVFNGLSDYTHPTQIICDLLTIQEAKGKLEGLTLAYIGDGNNVCNSLLLGCALAGMNMSAACPDGYHPDQKMLESAKKIAGETGVKLNIVKDPKEAAKGADILYADTWVSMGQDAEKEKRLKIFAGYQINAELLSIANEGAQVMHCLPAYRGLEITEEMLDGPRSIAWEQGENKMWGAVGILDYFLR